MDERFARRPIAGWYLPAAIIALILFALLLAATFVHLTTDAATLPADQRAQFAAEPMWMVLVAGLSGVAGALGSVMLILRRHAAVPLLFLSLVAIAIWFCGLFANAHLRELLATAQIAMAIIVLAIVWTIYWFARHSRQRGWLS